MECELERGQGICLAVHTLASLTLPINDSLRTVTGTPAYLPILTSIQPTELCRKGVKISLARRPMEPEHLLHSALTCQSNGNARHLKSRHPFVPAAQQLISSADGNNRSAVECRKVAEHYEPPYFHSQPTLLECP